MKVVIFHHCTMKGKHRLRKLRGEILRANLELTLTITVYFSLRFQILSCLYFIIIVGEECCTCATHTVSRPGHSHPALSLLSVKCLLSVSAVCWAVKEKRYLLFCK